MNNEKIAVGLDIGTTKIVAIVGKKNEHGKLEILGKGQAKSLGVHRGVVNNITQTINSIKEAVEAAEKASGHKITEVTVGIAGQHIRSLQHSDYITRPNFEEVINENDIKKLINQVHKLVMLPGEEIIHVLPQEFKIDSEGEITEPMGMYGSRLEANFHVVVGQVSSIKNVARCIKSAGLTLVGITLEPLASAKAALSKEETEAGVALIDIGGGTTDIAIFKDNIIRHTSVIPFGGNVITEDIKTGCSIIERQAELLKTKFGSSWPGEMKETEFVSIRGLRGRQDKEISLKRLAQIIHARINEILGMSFLELKNYGCEEHNKKLIAGIVMTGGGSKLKHIRQLTEFVTGMDVRIGNSNEYLSGPAADQLASPEYATAVGLLMKGLEKIEEDAWVQEEIIETHHATNTASKFQTTEEENQNLFASTPNPTESKITETAEEERDRKDPFMDAVLGKSKTNRRSNLKPKSNIFSVWTDKFIKMINETE